MELKWSLRVFHSTWNTRNLTSTPFGAWGLDDQILFEEKLSILLLLSLDSEWEALSTNEAVIGTSLRVLETGVLTLPSPWSSGWLWFQCRWGTNKSRGFLFSGFSLPGSKASLKACYIINSLYFHSPFLRDLPLKEVQFLHLLGICESPKQWTHWECPLLTGIAFQQER